MSQVVRQSLPKQQRAQHEALKRKPSKETLIRHIEIRQVTGQPLGLELVKQQDGIYVLGVQPESVCVNQVFEGDRIIFVNDVAVNCDMSLTKDCFYKGRLAPTIRLGLERNRNQVSPSPLKQARTPTTPSPSSSAPLSRPTPQNNTLASSPCPTSVGLATSASLYSSPSPKPDRSSIFSPAAGNIVAYGRSGNQSPSIQPQLSSSPTFMPPAQTVPAPARSAPFTSPELPPRRTAPFHAVSPRTPSGVSPSVTRPPRAEQATTQRASYASPIASLQGQATGHSHSMSKAAEGQYGKSRQPQSTARPKSLAPPPNDHSNPRDTNRNSTKRDSGVPLTSPSPISFPSPRSLAFGGASFESHPNPHDGIDADLTLEQRAILKELCDQGFTREECLPILRTCHWNIGDCLGQLIARMEEEEFQKQLAIASILSEEAKRADEENRRRREQQMLRSESDLCSLFPKSVLLELDTKTAHLRSYASNVPLDQDQRCRELLTLLLQHEGKALKWYPATAPSYMKEVALRLESSMTKLQKASRPQMDLELLDQEVKTLEHLLFGMPEVSGGVPLLFLQASKALKLHVDERTGAEVIEINDDDD